MDVNWTNEAIESLRETFLKEKPIQLSRFSLYLPTTLPPVYAKRKSVNCSISHKSHKKFKKNTPENQRFKK